MTKKDFNHMYMFWRNMMDGKCYTKGAFDSKVAYRVLATRHENYFSPETCYIDYVANLPDGTCYVDAEQSYKRREGIAL